MPLEVVGVHLDEAGHQEVAVQVNAFLDRGGPNVHRRNTAVFHLHAAAHHLVGQHHTKPVVAREHFAAKGVHVDPIKLYGSMELAPLVGLADAIVDVVSTGGTLKANDLVEVEEIMTISSRLVVNQASLKTRYAELAPLLERLARAVGADVLG